MESTACSFDELLCQSLLLFRQYHFYNGCLECEVEASRALEAAHHLMVEAQNGIYMAKWGCALECLAQKYYINDNTDKMLSGIDVVLMDFWKKREKLCVEAFSAYLWLGYYFLLRFRNGQSSYHNRSKRAMSEILSFLIDIFHKFKKQSVSAEVLALFSPDVWGETVCWVEQVYDSHLCEKQSASLLHQLYDLRKTEVSHTMPVHDILLQQILEFYCF